MMKNKFITKLYEVKYEVSLQLTLCSGLPYGLRFIDESERFRMIDLIEQSHFIGGGSPGFYHSEKATKKLSAVMGKKMVMDEDLKDYHVLDIKPILRSMDDLTKPITQDGETFVPMVEIFKLIDNVNHVDYNGQLEKEELQLDDGWNHVITYRDENLEYVSLNYDVSGSFGLMVNDEVQLLDCQQELFDLLDKWHFNRRGLDPDQYIDVKTLKDNCY